MHTIFSHIPSPTLFTFAATKGKKQEKASNKRQARLHLYVQSNPHSMLK